MSDPQLYAVLAEFDAPEKLLAATRAMRAKGFDNLDAFSPFPVEGLSDALGFSESAVHASTLIGGIVGAATGVAMQAATKLDYPLWIGGRPLLALPAFLPITFDLLILGAVLGCVGSLFVANRLPRLNHPVFEAPEFTVGDPHRFFLAVLAGEDFDRAAVGKALASVHPEAIIDVPEVP